MRLQYKLTKEHGDLTIDGDRKDVILIRESNGQRSTTKLDLEL